MVTYFNKKDMISFGNYLLSEDRKIRYEAMDLEFPKGLSASERLKEVSHADFVNWKKRR